MTLSLDTVLLSAPDVAEARTFYRSALSPTVTDECAAADLDMHGAGRFAVAPAETLATNAGAGQATSGFRGYVLSYVLTQPTGVRTVREEAVRGGANTLKPAKKALFGSYSAVFRAPDGSVWKLAASTGEDTGPAATSPRPTETTLILGVRDPKTAKTFYEALGMRTDRDYGSKYVDFHPADGAAGSV
ncbi:hypothetical protein [Streptomyces oceani]|uniref:hypothetical protein n=1 Tax=Streptomyces oceani TaxID=1075402 RepID=UPI0009A12ACC|nr:hypothetical protein [Streptomyces oceani]